MNVNDYIISTSTALSKGFPPPAMSEIDWLSLTDQQLAQLEEFNNSLGDYTENLIISGDIAGAIGYLADLLGRISNAAAIATAVPTLGRSLKVGEIVGGIIDAAGSALTGGIEDWATYADDVALQIEWFQVFYTDNNVDENQDGDPDNDTSNPNDESSIISVDAGAGGKSAADYIASLNDTFLYPPASPLVIDLDGDGIELTTLADSSVQFDLDLDGFAERTGWVAPDDAFLAYDRNGNGRIDDQSELFGNSATFANGFLSLADLDSNNDGIIDQNDTVFADLTLWQDANIDGATDAGELTSLVDAGITSIDLNSTSVSETNNGHTVSDRSSVTWSDGNTSVIEDIWFENDQRISAYILPEDFSYTSEALLLPVLFGMGHIASTWVALSLDATLVSESKLLVEKVNAGDILGFEADFEQFLMNWAGVSDIDPSSRGGAINAQHLTFLEKVYGTGYSADGSSNPGGAAGIAIESQFNVLVNKLAAHFVVQASNSGTTISILETGLLPSSASAVDFLKSMSSTLEPETNRLSASVDEMVVNVMDAVSAGQLEEINAARIIHLLRYDLEDLNSGYSQIVTLTLENYGNQVAAGYVKMFLEHPDSGVVLGTDNVDVLVGSAGDDILIGKAADDDLQGNGGNDVFVGGTGNDTLTGGYGDDSYYYSLGDGVDTINDYDDYFGTDKLVLTDINASDVSVSRVGNDVLITFTNGETVTLINQMNNSRRWHIEVIEFADGTVWSKEDLKGQVLEAMKSTGLVTGTYSDETYYHTAGDGSYSISDYDDYSGSDKLVFTNYNLSDISISSSGSDAVLTLTNGETITLVNQYGSNRRWFIENFEFADGAPLTWLQLLDATVHQGTDGSDIIAGSYQNNVFSSSLGNDTIYGGDGSDTYVFARGGGQDVIEDNGSWDTDTLHISGYTIDEVIFHPESIGSSTLIITFVGTTDQIRLVNAVSGDKYDGIEQVKFDDGTTMNWATFYTFATQNFIGTVASETITGSASNDIIDSKEGDDVVNAGDGDDYVFGGLGNDLIYGGAGNDVLVGGAAQDSSLVSDGQLNFEYFKVSSSIATVDDIPVAGLSDAAGTVANFDVNTLDSSNGGSGDYYGVRYSGILTIETAGLYTLQTGSDDGSDLWIDGIRVVNNDGLHGLEYQNGSIYLEAGNHNIELNFFERSGGNILSASIQGPDTSDTLVDLFSSKMIGSDLPTPRLSDTLNGGTGNDILTGGSGADIIELAVGDGLDVMTDFEDGIDIIEFTESGITFTDLTIANDVNGDATISYATDGNGNPIDQITLTGIDASLITQEDFLFA